MSVRYLIEVTAEQLCGLQHALVCARQEYERAIPSREKSVAYWNIRGDEKALVIAEANLDYAKTHLALVQAAEPAVYSAEVIPDRARRHNKLPFPSAAPLGLGLANEAAAATPSLGGERGASPSPASSGGGTLGCQSGTFANALTCGERY